MKFKKLGTAALLCLSVSSFSKMAYANEVLLTANQPIKVSFSIAHKNPGEQPVFSEVKSIELNKNFTQPIDLNGYALAGVVIVSVNGHELPPSANQFDQPQQCSMTTDKIKSTGSLELSFSAHAINCRTYGGIFG